jgi:tRNA threonylcarbamoyladenosine biosynthesis protein TsaB
MPEPAADPATLLAFDCSGGACSAALLAGGRTVAQRSEPMAHGHGERLIPMLRAVMAEAGRDFAGLDAVAVTVGPGRFTGLRIGIAAARGLALATGKPALGVASFAAVAAQAQRDRPAATTLLAVIDSGRDEIFAQLFDPRGRPQGDPRIATPAALAADLPAGPLLLAGDGAELVRRALADRPDAAHRVTVSSGPIRAEIVAALGAAELATRGRDRRPPPRPIYLRAPDAKLPGAPR